jgi:hypothetical protein
LDERQILGGVLAKSGTVGFHPKFAGKAAASGTARIFACSPGRARAQESADEIALGEVATCPESPDQVAARERPRNFPLIQPAAVQLLDATPQLDKRIELPALRVGGIFHTPPVLAEQHHGLECQHAPQRIEQGVNILIGAQVL